VARKGKNNLEAFITEAEGWGKERERGGKFEKPTRREYGALFGLRERKVESQSALEVTGVGGGEVGTVGHSSLPSSHFIPLFGPRSPHHARIRLMARRSERMSKYVLTMVSGHPAAEERITDNRR